MIKLTRLNEKKIVINAEMIKFIEETPDTMITLRDSDKVLVRESVDEVILKAIEYSRIIRNIPGL
mgnify:FL=1